MRRTIVRTAGTVLAAGALLSTAAACGGGGSGNNSGNNSANPGTQVQKQGNLPRGGTLKIVAQGDLTNLDTSQEYEAVGFTLFRDITRQLVATAGDPAALPNDKQPVDDLAASHTVSPDGLTYTFTLRDGVHYTGPTTRAIKASDFTYAIKRLCDPNGSSGAIGYYTATINGLDTFCDGFAKVKTGDPKAVQSYIDGNQVPGIQTPDDKTITFKLKQPAGDFLNILAMPFATPVPEEVLSPYLTDSPEMRQHFVSSGPYTLTSYVPDKSYTFKRVPDYNAANDPLRNAYVDEVDVDLTVGSDDAEFQQIQAGTADISLDVTAPPLPVVRQLSQTKDPTLRVSDEGRLDYLIFNLKTGANAANTPCSTALQKPQVRQAFAYAANKAHLAQVLGGTVLSRPTGQIMTTSITGYQPFDPYSTPGNTGDPNKAKQLLAQAGYPNGLTCNYIYRNGNVSKSQDVGVAVQQDLGRAGINVKLSGVPSKDYYGKHLQLPNVNDWDIAVPAWAPDWQGNAGRTFFVPLVDGQLSPCAPGTTNYGCYNNPQVNQQVDAALKASDPGPLYAQVDKTATTDLPFVPLLQRNSVTISSKRIQGWRWNGYASNPDIANLSVGG
jgi:peptide/nickel transport system substrate-binding protein